MQTISKGDLYEFVVESNEIESIFEKPTERDLEVYSRFLAEEKVRIPELKDFVMRIADSAPLRSRVGADVRVGRHVPPAGGEQIVEALTDLLVDMHVADTEVTVYDQHHRYETLHPFMDGNGRSGRALWLRGMLRLKLYVPDYRFLRYWYYQTLSFSRAYGDRRTA